MIFLTPGEKLRKLRNNLSVKQYELEDAGITRNFICMIEANKRGLSKKSAERLVDFFYRKAFEKGIDINISANNLILQPKEEARLYCEEILHSKTPLDYFEELTNTCFEYELYDLLGEAYLIRADELYNTKDYIGAFTSYSKSLEYYDKAGMIDKRAFMYNKLGKCKIMELNYTEALLHFEKARNLALANNDLFTQKNTLFNLALTYKKLNKLENAINYINEYLTLCDINANLSEYANAIIVKANCYLDLKDLTTCVSLYKSIANKFSNRYDPLLVYVYSNLTKASIELKDYNTSLYYIEEAIEISRVNNNTLMCSHLYHKAKILFNQNFLNSSLTALKESIEYAVKYNEKICLLQDYYLLSEIYIQMDNKENLEAVYKDILILLKEKGDKEEVVKINRKLALLKLEASDIENSKKYLTESI